MSSSPTTTTAPGGTADGLDRIAQRQRELARDLGREAPWLAKLREEGLSRFLEQGFPSTRSEEWRYTNVSALAKAEFALPGPGAAGVDRERVEALSFPVFACSLVVFVNGRFAPELSAPRVLSGEIRARSLAELRGEDAAELRGLGSLVDLKRHPFAALNTAFLDDGAVLRLPAGAALPSPVHAVFITTAYGDGGKALGPQTHPRLLVHAERGSQAKVVLDFVTVGDGPSFTNCVGEVVLEDDARLDLVLLQRESDAAHHVANLAVRQGRDSRLATHSLSLGGALVRNDLEVTLSGPGAECRLRGLFLGTGRQVVDNHTLVDHAVPHCTSDELYKGVLAGSARGVFRGRVVVRPDAQKTNARQSNPNLLLGERAEVDTKPQLEIWADDVKCSHGSTVGQIDADALFYLRSRGVGEAEARDLLTRGFAAEITRGLPEEALGERVAELLVDRLREEGEGR